MKIVGMMLARNEDWIIGQSLAAALLWCDEVCVLLHACTDRTVEIVEQLARDHEGRVWFECDGSPVCWDEMDLRQDLLELAGESNPTHLAMIDADEIATANVIPQVRGWCGELGPGEVLELPMIAPWRSLEHYRADRSVWCGSQISLALRADPKLHYADRDGYQHHSRVPVGAGKRIQPLREIKRCLRQGDSVAGGVFHLQWLDWPRLVAKHTWYKMTERVRWPDRKTPEQIEATYEQALDERGVGVERLPSEWIEGLGLEKIELGREPWQRAECLAMLCEHGREFFDCLTLRGIDEQVGAEAAR